MVGQRLHIDDLIGMLLRSGENWTVLSLPAIAEKDEYIPIGPGRWHLRRMGELLHPEQQSASILRRFVLGSQKSMRHSISKVRSRRAASSSSGTRSNIVMNCRDGPHRQHTCRAGILRKSRVKQMHVGVSRYPYPRQ